MTLSATVVDGKLMRTSPSAIETFNRCPTAWWLRYVAHVVERIRESVKNAQNLGTRAHGQLEYYLLGCALDVTDPFAKALLRYAPARGADLIVEGRTELLSLPDGPLRAAGILVTGRIDWTHGRVPARPIVADWKTRSDLDRYKKTEADLKHDVQMSTYAKWASGYYPHAESVDVGHYYVETKHHKDRTTGCYKENLECEPRTDVVLVNFSLDDIKRSWSDIENAVEAMKAVAALGKASACKAPNEEDRQDRQGPCNAFGGCGYRWACPYWELGCPPGEKKEPSMGLMELLKAEQAKRGVVAAPEQAVVAEQELGVVPPDAAPELPVAVAQMVPAPGKLVALVQDPRDPEDRKLDEQAPVPSKLAALVQDPRDPEDRKLDEQAAATKHMHVYDVKVDVNGNTRCACGRKRPGRPRSQPRADLPTPPPLAPRDPLAVPRVTATEHHPALAPKPPEAKPAPTPLVAVTPEAKPSCPGCRKGLVLYVNAITSVPTQNLVKYVYDAAKAIAVAGGASGADPRFVENKNGPLAFGGWRGALAEYVRASPPEGPCSIYTAGDEIAETVVAALAPIAVEVVRGV